MFIPVFHEADQGEWHWQQVHHEVPRDANAHGKFFAAKVDLAEQRAQTNRLADEKRGIGQHDVLVEVEGLDVSPQRTHLFRVR